MDRGPQVHPSWAPTELDTVPWGGAGTGSLSSMSPASLYTSVGPSHLGLKASAPPHQRRPPLKAPQALLASYLSGAKRLLALPGGPQCSGKSFLIPVSSQRNREAEQGRGEARGAGLQLDGSWPVRTPVGGRARASGSLVTVAAPEWLGQACSVKWS